MPFNIKVGGAWKAGTGAKVKVGGAWKTVESIQVKVGGAWKVAFTNSISPAITATVSPNPSSFSQDVTISGFVLPVPTGGTVLVRDSGENPVGTQANVNTSTGAYSITIPDQGIGTYTFSVNYSGFDLYQPASTNVTVNVGTIPTTTTITRSASTYRYNQTRVTLSGVVSPTPLSGGTVNISSPTQGYFGAADVSVVNGSYSLIVPIKDVGSYTNIFAAYGGSGNYASSTSGTTSYSVTQDLPVLSTVSPSGSSVQAGSTITFSSSFAAPALSGRTVIFEGLNSSSVWVNLGSGVSNASGQASFVWTAVAGYTQIRARYLGETNYASTTSVGTTTVTVTTNITTTTTSARSAASYAYNGTRVVISGTVSPAPSGGTITISGRIDAAGTTNFVTGVPVNTSTGAYSATMPIQDVGSYTAVIANYIGSGLYLSSSSAAAELSYDITKASTALSTPGSWGAVSSASSINSGDSITSSVTLTTGGVAFANQSITFQKSSASGYVNIATVSTNSSGVASTTWTPSAGSQDVRAVYTATTNYSGVTSSVGSGYARTQYSDTYSSGAVQNDYQFRGCNINTAEQVATTFTMPNNTPNGVTSFDYVVTSMTVRASGYLGESGSIRGCIWNNSGSTTLVTSSGYERPASSALGTMRTVTCDLTNATVTKGAAYMAGFWREDANCSYTTQWGFQNDYSGATTYYDNSESTPGTFDKNTTLTTASLIFTVSYTYWA